jgi:hypothetical protein
MSRILVSPHGPVIFRKSRTALHRQSIQNTSYDVIRCNLIWLNLIEFNRI